MNELAWVYLVPWKEIILHFERLDVCKGGCTMSSFSIAKRYTSKTIATYIKLIISPALLT